MKLQIAFDIPDLEKSLAIAEKIQSHVDVFEVGTILLYKYGTESVRRFKEAFPQKTILADAKVIDRARDAVTLLASAGADWITVMAGADSQTIHTASTVAHEFGKKIMLDLADSSSLGQSALEAKSLGADALIFHKPLVEDAHMVFLDRWEMVKGNTTLPITISAQISRENVAEFLTIGASGMVIGSSVVNAPDPAAEIAYFADIVSH